MLKLDITTRWKIGFGNRIMKSTLENFLSKISVGDDCWVWKGGLHKDGYGHLSYCGKYWLSHRLSYQTFVGKIPSGMNILHKCDNPPCCNPKHLFVGTQKDNVHDMEKKGRANHPSGENHGSKTKPESRPRGERAGLAKLTDNLVLEIREKHASGGTFRGLARQYGVDRVTISAAVKRKTWAHI